MNQSLPKFHANIFNVREKALLLPFGLYLNNGLDKLNRGDLIVLTDECNIDVRIKHKRKIKVNSSEFVIWLDMIYGSKFSWEKLECEWENYSVIMGYGSQGFSREDCWLLIVELVKGVDEIR